MATLTKTVVHQIPKNDYTLLVAPLTSDRFFGATPPCFTEFTELTKCMTETDKYSKCADKYIKFMSCVKKITIKILLKKIHFKI